MRKVLIVTLILVLSLPLFFVSSQEDCGTRQECEALLQELEEQIKQISALEGATEQEIKTRQSQISAIRSRINQLDLQIRRSNIVIQDLGLQIQDTEGSIEATTVKIGEERQKLAQVLKTIYEEDQKSLLEVLLSESSLSVFFDNLMALENLDQRNSELLDDIKSLKAELEAQREKLDGERQSLTTQVKAQTLQKQESETARKEQEQLLRMNETQYKLYVQQRQLTEQRAAEIRARLFQLAGVPDVEAPTFGQALEMAQWVQQQTGVRPAFLLSIITQESALARNVGQCYLSDTSSGKTYNITTNREFRRGINPSRDLPRFLQITQELGRDPLRTPLSCWIDVGRGPNFGWGGAMGPAQFIPYTWMTIRDKVSSITGNTPANPWSVRDSFLAAGILLRDLGADFNEARAAARYFGASTPFPYSSTVMTRTRCMDTFISQGTLSDQCERLVFNP
ncbi:MAG: hypothetical protein G01um101430_671 [Parcubacteria group bacterium Gr01-1014_30]|nr:MAG: hypothetical protein G01um101430_671 [Parcubacteria group bacterium Gr01-1014_30]